MMVRDKDLISVQEVRDLVGKAKEAQEIYKSFPQEEMDKIVRAMALKVSSEAERLARMAHDETGFGRWQSKYEKNKLASDLVYQDIKDKKLVGVLNKDEENKIIEVGVPMGVIAGLIPSTNPTSTTIYKALIALKTGNAIVFSPHPSAINCISETAKILNEVAVANGAPEGLISSMNSPTIQGTNELMTHKDVNLILATGGSGMVKAAYSSGNPALGVGPGNVPVYIEKTANTEKAVDMILESKTFDNGMICASEESIIVDEEIKSEVMRELERRGGYFLDEEEYNKLKSIMLTPKGGLNPRIVGKDAKTIGREAGLDLPNNVVILLYEEKGIGPEYAFSREKLTMTLGFYTAKSTKEAMELATEILNNDGLGHSAAIHSEDDEVILEYGLLQPVSRVLVNTPTSQGGVGLLTNLVPALTLGCGAVGGSATSDNVSVDNLINKKRIAYGVKSRLDRSETPRENSEVQIDEEMIKKIILEELNRIK